MYDLRFMPNIPTEEIPGHYSKSGAANKPEK